MHARTEIVVMHWPDVYVALSDGLHRDAEGKHEALVHHQACSRVVRRSGRAIGKRTLLAVGEATLGKDTQRALILAKVLHQVLT